MIKLFTHNDLDGAGCAILAKLLYDEDVDITYCANPADLTKKLNKTAKHKFERIYITDCSFIFDELTNTSFLDKCYIFDHHKTATPLIGRVKHAVINTSESCCGTELFYAFLKTQGFLLDVSFFVEQIRLYDTWEWAKYRSQMPKYLDMLVEMFGIEHFVREYTYKLSVEQITDLNMFSPAVAHTLWYENERRQRETARALKEVQLVYTTDYAIGVVFGNYGNDALHAILDGELGVHIAMNINPVTGNVRVRTDADDIELGKIMKKSFQGGGHNKAAGGVLDIDNDTKVTIFNYLLGSAFGDVMGVDYID